MPARPLLILAMAVLATGCTTTSKMSVADLNDYKIDCSKKDQQIEFLYSQIPSRGDQAANAFILTGITSTVVTTMDGTYDRRREAYRGHNRAIILSKIDYIRKYCR